VGETASFLEVTALFSLAVAEVHGLQIEDLERRRTLLLREEVIEARGVLLERTGRGRAINATGHGTSSPGLPLPAPFNKLPLNASQEIMQHV
jgi:hypothetical protein